jgi:hypothetical protein
MNDYYSTLSPMNATDSLVLINSTDGYYRIKDIAGNIVVPASNMPQMNNTRVLWDASNGNVFYYASGNSLMQGTIGGAAPNATVTTTTVRIFNRTGEYVVGVIDLYGCRRSVPGWRSHSNCRREQHRQ